MNNTTKTYTPGPLAWQKCSNEYCLTGQYGMRLIVLSVSGKGALQLRNAATDLLIPFSPDHPDARLLAAAPDLLEALRDMVSDVGSLSEATLDFARAAIAKAAGAK